MKTTKVAEKLKVVLLTLTIFLCCTATISAQRFSAKFPRELLPSRIDRISKLSNTIIAYDTKTVEKLQVEPLEFSENTVEQILEKTLEGTKLETKKVSGSSYSIVRAVVRQPQQNRTTGTVKGRIVETETSEPIIGAIIKVLNTQLAVISDDNGYYSLPKIPSGKNTIEITYMGFKTEQKEIRIDENKTANYDVKMSGDSQLLSEVVVSGIRKQRGSVPHTTEKIMVQEIKELKVVASGISSEQISRSADRNAAQAVQRVSGVSVVDDKFIVIRGLNERYGFTYLNDNVAPSTEIYSRAFALDLIPSRVIDKILVFKSPSPENQADATGGVVKIYTKDAQAVRHFDVELQVGYREGTTFNSDFLSYKGGKYDFLGFDDGVRGLPSSVPHYGALATANLKPSEYVKTFSPVLTYGKKKAMPNTQFTANYYDAFPIFNKYLTMLTSLSYKNEYNHSDVYRQQGVGNNWYVNDKVSYDNKNTETAQINLLQNFSFNLNDKSKLQFKNFILQQGVSTTLTRFSHLNRDAYSAREKDNILLYNQRFLYAGNFGGVHHFQKDRQELQWNVGVVRNTMEMPDQRVLRFESRSQDVATGDVDLQWISRGRYSNNADLGDPRKIQLGMLSRVWSKLVENVYNFSADYKWKMTPWFELKTGTFQSWRERHYNRRVYTVNEGDLKNRYSDNATLPGSYGQYLDPNLVRYNEMALPNLWTEQYFRDDLSGLKVIDRTAGTDTYIGTEQNNSAYLSGALELFGKKLNVSGGLRYEYNRQKIGGALPRDITSATSINIPVLIDNETKHWLPSINLTWKQTESWVFRASYGETVNRFEFREAAPFTELDYESNQNIQGNPALQTTHAKNYDFRMEFYPGSNGVEIISAGVFYKDLDKPIERILNADRVVEVFPSITYVNANSATIKGVEIELRKSFDFIPLSFFRNLSINANVSFIKSESMRDSTMYLSGKDYNNANSISYKRTLQGQAPFIFNAGLYYENPNWGTKLSVMYNTVGTRLYAAGMPYVYDSSIQSPLRRGSIFELQRHLWDLSITQRIAKSMQMKFTVQNLFNKPVQMAEDSNFSGEYEAKKITIREDGSELNESDNIYSSYNPGRYFSLSFSYSF